jgi:hypothetical protein
LQLSGILCTMMEHPGEHADDRDRREQHRERSEERNGEDADRADRADRRGSQNGNNNHNEHVVDYDEVNNEDYRYGDRGEAGDDSKSSDAAAVASDPRATATLFVKNFPRETISVPQLVQHFEQFGVVNKAVLRSFNEIAFIEFETIAGAIRAKAGSNGTKVLGATSLFCDFKKTSHISDSRVGGRDGDYRRAEFRVSMSL